jgi:hypothetical protein
MLNSVDMGRCFIRNSVDVGGTYFMLRSVDIGKSLFYAQLCRNREVFALCSTLLT